MTVVSPPDEWSCENDNKQAKVEVSVRTNLIDAGVSFVSPIRYEWVEIPVTNIELWENKSGNADINRLAKVEHPIEWAGESVSSLIDPLHDHRASHTSYCRLWFREDADSEWFIKHHGFIGGAGGGGRRNRGKFWVYDFAELTDDVPFHGTLKGTMTPDQVIEDAVQRLNDETHISVDKTPLFISRGDEMVRHIISDPDHPSSLAPQGQLNPDAAPNASRTSFPDINRDTTEKRFYFNEHTVKDVLDWIADWGDSIWYFAPTPHGARLVFDANPQRILYDQTGAVSDDTVPWSKDISVIRNTAMHEIAPMNTVIAMGQPNEDEKYPTVKVRARSIFEKTRLTPGHPNGVELTETMNVDAGAIGTVRQEARKRLRELLEEASEGRIKLFGKPQIQPFDGIRSHYTCAEWSPDDVLPLEYEVEEIKHEQSGGGRYKATAYVSVWVDDDDIEIVNEYLVDTEGDITEIQGDDTDLDEDGDHPGPPAQAAGSR